MSQFKFGNFSFPDKYIARGAVNIKPNQRQDLDSYTDGYGVTQRSALSHTKTEISFSTIPMSGKEMREIMQGMVSNYIDYNERDSMCEYYDDENGVIKTGHFYLDPSTTLNRAEVDSNGIPTRYGQVQWLFIEY